MVKGISSNSLSRSMHTHYIQQKNAGVVKTDNSGEEKLQNAISPSSVADTVEISPEAQKAMRNAMLASMTLQEIAPSPQETGSSSSEPTHLKETAAVLPSREQLHAGIAAKMANRTQTDPFDNEFHINNVTYVFPESNISISYNQHIKVAEALEGKARNATLVASELVNTLQGSIFSGDLTVAERAIAREAAFRSAQYIADNYFDNPAEAKNFMELITKIKDDDILREKGWVASDHFWLVEPYRNYSAPGSPIDHVSPKGVARHFGASDEILADAAKTLEFIRDEVTKRAPLHSESDALKWDSDLRSEIISGWNSFERDVSETIIQTLATFDADIADNYLQRILKAF